MEDSLSNLGETYPSRPIEVVKHISALDGVRGLAIALVLMCHLFWANNQTANSLYNFVQRVTLAGWIGVDLFFVLSGFLITGILFGSLDDRNYFKNFFGRRALRIFPLYYLVVIAVCLVFHAEGTADLRPLTYLLLYLQNTPLWFHLPASPVLALLTNLWSLATEEQFYLVWPLIVFMVRDRRPLLWIAGLGALCAPIIRTVMYAHGVPGGIIYVMTICRADSLLCGAWLALMMRGGSREKVLNCAPYVFCCAVAGSLWVAYSGHGFNGETVPLIRYGYTVLAIGMTSLVAMALRPGSAVETIMRTRALRLLGKYSYGIYVLHGLVIALLEVRFTPWMRQHVHSLVLYHLIFPPIVAGLTLAVAIVSFRFYEQPFLRMKRLFNYRPEVHVQTGRQILHEEEVVR